MLSYKTLQYKQMLVFGVPFSVRINSAKQSFIKVTLYVHYI